MNRQTILFVAFAALAAPKVRADVRDCRELFVAPLVAKTQPLKPDGRVWDEGSPMDAELTAKPKDRSDIFPMVVGPKRQDQVYPKWNSVFVEPGQFGAWMPARVGDTVRFVLTDRDALSDDLIDSFEVEIPKTIVDTGVAIVNSSGSGGTVLSIRFSISDGKRACAGLTDVQPLRYEIPEGTLALPDPLLFASIAKHNRCNVNQKSPACQRDAYVSRFSDGNNDKVVDALTVGGPFASGGAVVVAVTLGVDPRSRRELFVGDCDKIGFLEATSEFMCTADGKTQAISLKGANGGVRDASAADIVASNADTAALLTREARSYLKALFTAEAAWFGEKDRYSTDAAEIGFRPSEGNRYTYFLAPRGVVLKRDGTAVRPVAYSIIGVDTVKYPNERVPSGLKEAGCPLTFGTNADGEPIGLGVTGTQPNQEFIGYAVGNIDEDADFDCWSVATFERTAKDGSKIPKGVPFHEKHDVVTPSSTPGP